MTAGTLSVASTGTGTVSLSTTPSSGGVGTVHCQLFQNYESGANGNAVGSAQVDAGSNLSFSVSGLASATYYFTAVWTDSTTGTAQTATSNQLAVGIATGTAPSSGANATGYQVLFPAAVATHTASVVYVVLTGGLTLTAPLVVTLKDNDGVFGGPVTIASGSTYGSTTYTPNDPGHHTVTATHSGGNSGFTDPTIAPFIASIGTEIPQPTNQNENPYSGPDPDNYSPGADDPAVYNDERTPDA